MSITGVAAKNAPVVAPIVAGALALNNDALVTIGAVVIGLVFGAMWRTGSFLSEGKSWIEIRADLTVSVLIGGANAILTLALVDWLQLGLLFTMAMGAVIGATGLRALPEIREAVIGAARRRLLEQNVALIEPKDGDMDEKIRQLGDTPPTPDRQPDSSS